MWTDYNYIPRKEGGRGLISVEDCWVSNIRFGRVYSWKWGKIDTGCQRRQDGLEAASVLKRSKKEKRLEDWKEKVLRGQYLRQTKEVRSDQCWAWLQNGD